MMNLWQDLRYGVRMLLNKPAFTFAAVLVLALGIGANAAVFSLVNTFLLKPLHIDKPEEIVGVYGRDTKKPDSYRSFSYPNYLDLRESNPVFSAIAAHNPSMVGVGEGETTRRVFADIVSANYFTTFGVPLFQGRAFSNDEERPGSETPVAIVSFNYWKRHGSDPALIGKTIRVNGRILNIVGVTAEGFTGSTAMISPEVYVPLGLHSVTVSTVYSESRSIADRGNHSLLLVGRLKPGILPKDADTKLSVVASQLEKAFPAENRDQTIVVRRLSRLGISTSPSSDGGVIAPLIFLMAMGGIILLIASLNLANLMLARGTARRKEVSIRLAIGANRGQIVRQLFTEGLLLSLLGGLCGLAVAYWSTSALVSSLSSLSPIDVVITSGPDARILAATFAFCLFSTIVFGLWPAWKLSKPDVISDLKESAGEDSSGESRRFFSRRNVLVIAQISLSLTMLAAAGLFVRSAVRAAQIEPGFRLEAGVIAEVDPGLVGYDEARGRQVFATLLARLATIPGVDSVALAATAPFGMISLGESVRPAERSANQPETVVSTRYNIITGDYFLTLGVPVVRGRTFRSAETLPGNSTTRVAIVDQLAAAKLWPNQDPIGKHLLIDPRASAGPNAPRVELEVVGIVAPVKSTIFGNSTEPALYVPFGYQYQSDMQIHLKISAQGPDAEARLLDSVRREIRAVDDHLPVLALKTIRTHLDSSFELWSVRTGARMFGLFGAVAMLLAVIGLYGVKAYTVARRTREIGVRMALGATAQETLRMILSEGLKLTLVGVGIGFVLALGMGKLLSGFLYEVSAFDPIVLSVAPLFLTITSLAACYIPARRAAKVDPIIALRYE